VRRSAGGWRHNLAMSHGATARLFVAVDLPAAVRQELARWARGAASSARANGGHLRLLEPESLHVTLCFLGDRSVGALDAIAAAVMGAPAAPAGELVPAEPTGEPSSIKSAGELLSAEPTGELLSAEPTGELSLGAPLWLPGRRPRALAVELHDDARGSLGLLRDAVSRSLQDVCGFEPERRRFRPHVTVARTRSGDAPRERALPATPQLAFTPVALALYRSWLGPTEASYEALASRSLAG
jgi:2'-5' RNA ligase